MDRRMNFNEIFVIHPDGSIEPRQQIQVGGVSFGPGVRFGRGVSFSGIDFSLFIGRDFQVRKNDSTLNILGVYQ
jgi:hypothetical protein